MFRDRGDLVKRPRSPALRALRRDALNILEAGLRAVDPERVLRARVKRRGARLEVDGLLLDLGDFEAVRVLAAGKASVPMARAFLGIVEAAEALVVTSTEPPRKVLGAPVIRAGHPLPDEESLRAGEEALTLAGRCGPRDLLVVLLSGGASALLEATDLPLEVLRETTGLLLRSGLDIGQVNTVRRHLSRLKGGQLARRALERGGSVLTLALSDVVGDDPAAIASGPTVPDPTTFEDARTVLRRHGLWDGLPEAARARIEAGRAGEAEDTPKPGDPAFERALYRVVASVRNACQAAASEAERLGYQALILTTRLQGEARAVGQVLAAAAQSLDGEDLPVPRPAALLFGGETTVAVRGTGRGGRNQELVLAALPALAGRELVLLSCDTDGRDGTTDAAGAVADGESLTRAEALGLDPWPYLEANDAYGFFQPLGDLLRTGPTGTNVLDLGLVLAGPRPAD